MFVDEIRLCHHRALEINWIWLNLYGPVVEGLICLEFREQSQNSIHSCISISNFEGLDSPHILEISGEIVWQRSIATLLRW